MGNRLVRQISIARGQIVTAIAQLRRDRTTRAPDPVIATLESVSASLGSIERHFETAFERQFEKVSAEYRDSGPVSHERTSPVRSQARAAGAPLVGPAATTSINQEGIE
jgi:hypothetical protein